MSFKCSKQRQFHPNDKDLHSMCFFYPFTTYPYTHCPIYIQCFGKKIRAEKKTCLTPWPEVAQYQKVKFLEHTFMYQLNWWKGKPSESKACTRKQQPRFYWSCSSVVMNDATSLTPPSAWAGLHFQMWTTYMYTPWSLRTRKIWLHIDVVRGDFLQPPHRH